MKHIFLFFSFLLTGVLSATAGDPVWTNYTSKGHVKSMYEHNGSMWVATLGGVVKYDIESGKKTEFSKASAGLPSNTVEDITPDLANNIWIGTYDAGIAMYDGGKWTNYNTENSALPNDAVRAVEADKFGNVYIGTGEGLLVIKDNKWTIYNNTNVPNFHSNDIWTLALDDKNGLWIGSAHGVYYMYENVWTDYSDSLPLYGVNDINYSAAFGVVATGNGGAFQLNESTKTWKKLGDVNDLPGMGSALYAKTDTDNNLWVTTFSGIYKYNGTEWSSFDAADPSAQIMALCLDKSGTLWGAGWNGINKLENNEWKNITTLDNSIPENYVRNIASDKKGTVWINTNSSVTRYTKNGWETFSTANSKLPSKYIARVRTDKNGSAWFATDKGLAQYVGGNWIIFDMKSSDLTNDDFKDVGFDSKGNIWSVHENGISIITTKEWEHIINPDAMGEDERFINIAIDANDVAWLSTSRGDMYRYANKTWSKYSFYDNTFAGGYVMDLKIDPKTNRVWAGTWGGGLNYFDGEKWNTYKTDQPIIISAILFDSKDNLWSGSMHESTLRIENKEHEVAMYNPKNSPVPLGNISTLEEDENGNIWIGTSEGILVYSLNETASVPTATKATDLGFGKLFPNPATTNTTLAFTLGKTSQVQINITDVAGRTVTALPVQTLSAGEQHLKIDTNHLSDGTYIITLYADNLSVNYKLIISK
ncbi:MAG: Periplasmic ligand-binding sensor domain-containing protein [Bacteroidia bacterium]